MFCSTIIPTIGRPSLDRAVQSILNQQFIDGADFEVIVVNDSGSELPDAEWQRSDRVSIIETNWRERSAARNAGAAIAKGEYLHFLDDDDWLEPHALANFWHLAKSSDAGWLYGATQVVNRQHEPQVVLRHGLQGNGFLPIMVGEWIPLQSSLIKSEVFFEVGGFNPLLAGPEDIDLLRRIAQTYDLAEMPAVVASVVMGQEDSTTDYAAHHIGRRQAREKNLDTPDSFSRLQEGAANTYWQARLARIYMTSVLWNLQHRRLSAALSRALHGLAAILSKPTSLFDPGFWGALFSAYRSPAFEGAGHRARNIGKSLR
jgi:glycosyltransferase involved in cell wall biosynthesis